MATCEPSAQGVGGSKQGPTHSKTAEYVNKSYQPAHITHVRRFKISDGSALLKKNPTGLKMYVLKRKTY